MPRTRAGSVSSGEHSLSSYNSWALKNYIGMMEAGERNPQAVTAWRQMYLSRAKLKASSSTSALLAGFAMVRNISAAKIQII